MDPEGHPKKTWCKAIPEGRDRMQSLALVWLMGLLLGGMGIDTILRRYLLLQDGGRFALLSALIVSGIFAAIALALHAATRSGTLAGGLICFLLAANTLQGSHNVLHSALAPLATLVLLTFASTRAGRKKKAQAGLAEDRRGRDAAQVIANLGIAAVCATPLAKHAASHWWGSCCVASARMGAVPMLMGAMCLSALVEATGDTVSSEIGQAYGGRPMLLPALQRVEPGTDGAVTLVGTGAGVLAAALVALVGMWGLGLNLAVTAVAFATGVWGVQIDTLLGVSIERRGWWGNNLVNFFSTMIAAGSAMLVFWYFHF